MKKRTGIIQKNRTFFALLSILILNFTLAACSSSSPTTQYYILPSPENTRLVEDAETSSLVERSEMVHIAVLPAEIPEYLQKTQVFRRNNSNANVEINDYNRWAEDLSSAFQRVLASSVNNNLAGTDMYVTPQFRGVHSEYILSVYINSFEGDFNSDVALDAYWILQKGSHYTITDHYYGTLKAGGNYNSLVETQSALIELMAKQISTTLLELEEEAIIK